MIGLKNREGLSAIIVDELENIVAQFRGWALQEHNEDGSHRTAPAITNHVPTGAIMEWPTSTAPSNWLLCNGDQVSRVTYNPLFLLIGTTFGAGDGSTTFNLPDFRGRFALGKSAAGTGSTLGATGGAIDHTHTGGAHSHPAGTLLGPEHSHPISGSTGSTAPGINGNTATETSHVHAVDPPDTNLTFQLAGVTVDQNLDGLTTNVVSGFTGSPHTDIASFTSGAGSPHGHAAGTLAVDNHLHAVGTLSIGLDGTGAVTGSTGNSSATTGTANPPFLTGNWIVFTGVRAT